MSYEISNRLIEHGLQSPDIQAMLDIAAEIVYKIPGMTDPAKTQEAGEKMFIMVEFGFRRQQDIGLPADKTYFERLYNQLETSSWDILVK